MRLAALTLLVLGLAGQQEGTDPLAKRYGYEVEPAKYPQGSPDVALKSVVRAVDDRRIDYLLAQLADPGFVDKKVGEYKSGFQGPESARITLAFDRLAKETTRYYRDDPGVVRELRSFVKDAEWKLEEPTAVATAKGLPGRRVFMRKVGGRWFLENKQK